MKIQSSPSSSIIIVLTDGKLDIYLYELSIEEVHTLQGEDDWKLSYHFISITSKTQF